MEEVATVSSGRTRRRRKYRSLLRILVFLGLAIGAVFGALSFHLSNTRMLIIGGVYVVCACFFLVVVKALEITSQSRRGARASDRTDGNQLPRNSGMVLVLTVMLLGVVAALTVQAQVSASLALRHARVRGLRTNLRLAAADAVWHLLQERTAVTSRPNAAQEPVSGMHTVLPSGIETEVNVSAESSLGNKNFSLLAAGSSSDGGLFRIESSANASGITERVACFIHRDKKGKTQVLGWLENI